MIWLNGTLLPSEDARIDPADRGLTLGDGLFETIRAESGEPCHLSRHLARLRHGAAVLGIPVAFGDAALEAAMRALLNAAALPDAALRLTLTRGPAPRGLPSPAEPRPTILITAQPLPPPQAAAALVVARSTRRNEHSPLAAIKSLNYLDSILARAEATSRGADDAILLNTAGALACATAATLLLRLDGTWLTPRLQDGALPGISRARAIERGTLAERLLRPEDLVRAEGALLLTSLSVRSVASIEGEEKQALLF